MENLPIKIKQESNYDDFNPTGLLEVIKNEVLPIEIKEDSPSDDFRPTDVLEVIKVEENSDLEPEVTKSRPRNRPNRLQRNKIKNKRNKSKGYYVVVDKIYRCTICPFVTGNFVKLRYHFREHGISKYTKAPYKVDATQLSDILKNYLYEYVGGLFSCKVCEFTCRKFIKAKQHVDKFHLNVTPRCNICNKIFLNSRQLIRHDNSVHIEKPYECSECGYRSHAPIDKHMKIHRTEKDYVYYCTLCNYKTCLRDCWKDHKEFHYQAKEEPHLVTTRMDVQYVYVSSERVFQCNFCEFNHTHQEPVKAHIKKSHFSQIKSHRCVWCDETFVSLSELTMHRRVHIAH